MSASTVAFVGAFVYRFPVLRSLLQEHLDDQDGEVLPHLFIADVERWAEAQLECHDEASYALVRDVLAFLEAACCTQGDEVEELIAVSFLEHLPRPGKPGAELRSMVGPNLAKQLQRIG